MATIPLDVKKALLLFILVAVANLFDGLATLRLMQLGAEEANPWIREWIQSANPMTFLVWKVGLVTTTAGILAILKPYRRLASIALGATAAGFVLLAGYHCYLLYLAV